MNTASDLESISYKILRMGAAMSAKWTYTFAIFASIEIAILFYTGTIGKADAVLLLWLTVLAVGTSEWLIPPTFSGLVWRGWATFNAWAILSYVVYRANKAILDAKKPE